MSLPFGVTMAIFQKPALGLDISDHSIEAVFMVRRGDRLVVASYGRTTLPPGVIVDGYVERRDVAGLAIRKLLADKMTPPLPKGIHRVVFALPESQVYSHIFEVPRVADDAELGRSLAIEADGYFPYRHDEMSAGYAVIGQRPDRKDIYYAAVHKDTLKSYLDLFNSIGLSLEALENESGAIARAILLPNETEPVMIVDVGARVANVSVFDRNGIQFSEALETAGDAFTGALSRALGIPVEDADSLKRNQGLVGDFDLKAKKALQETADRLAKDVLAARDFYENKAHRPIGRVVMCGGTALLPGLVEYLSEKLSTVSRTQRVERADPWSGLELDPVLEKLNVRERGVLATTAVGLAMRGLGLRKFTDVNLLPTQVRGHAARSAAMPSPRASFPRAPGRHFPTWLKLLVAVAGVLGLAVGAWFLSYGMRGKPEAPPAAEIAAQEVKLEAFAVIGDYAEDPPTLPVAAVEMEAEARVTVERQGTEKIGYAKGRIEIVNEGAGAQTLVATTRFLSEGGVLFRLDERVTVPGGGRVQASITADKAGAEGDVAAGRFTIPGLSAAAQRIVYGVSAEPMRGGVTIEGAPFTAEDLAAVRGRLEAEAAPALEAAALAKIEPGMLHVADSLKIVEVRYIDIPAVGTPVGSFTAHAVVRAEAMAIDAGQAEIMLRRQLTSIPQGTAYALGPIEAALDASGLEPAIRLKAVASVSGENL